MTILTLVESIGEAPTAAVLGLMTGLVGAPFFGWLLWTRRHD